MNSGRLRTGESTHRRKRCASNWSMVLPTLMRFIAKAKLSAGLESARVVTYNHSAGRDSNIYSKLPMQVNLLNVDLRSIFGDGLPGFHYLWMPAD